MKHLIQTIAAVALVAFTVGCNPEPQNETTKSAISTEFVVDAQSSVVPISFNALTDWTATSSEAWAKLSAESGKAGDVKLSVTVEANDTYEDRSATVTISTSILSTEYKITQKMKNDFEIEMVYKISAEAQTIDFELKSNVEYNFTISAEAADWISEVNTKAAPSTSVKSFEIAANDGLSPRKGVIVVTTPETAFGIEVEQAAQFENLPNLTAQCLGRTMRIYNSDEWTYYNYNELALTLSDEESNTKVVLALNFEAEADLTTIPEGEFEVDAKDDHSPATFSIKSLMFDEPIYTTIIVDGSEVIVEDGAIMISKEGDTYSIVALLVDQKENVHMYSYVGAAPEVVDNSFGGYVVSNYFAAQYDTYYSTKANKWLITLVASKAAGEDVKNMNYISLTLYGKAGDNADPSEFPTGEFTVKAEETLADSHYANGIKLFNTGDCASISMYENNGDIDWSAAEGSKVTISKNEDGTFTFAFDATMTHDNYDEDWNYINTDEVPFVTELKNIRNTIEVDENYYAHQNPDADAVLDSPMTTQFVALYIGNKAVFEGLANPIEWNSTGSLIIVNPNNLNSFYNMYLPLIAPDYVFEKNFKTRYCSNQVADGTYTVARVPADNVILPVKYSSSSYAYIKNSWSGTTFTICGGSVEISNGTITYNLQASSPDGQVYNFTGSHAFAIQYAQDWSSRAKSFSIIPE